MCKQTRGVFRTQSNIYDEVFSLQKNSIVDVQLGSKCDFIKNICSDLNEAVSGLLKS